MIECRECEGECAEPYTTLGCDHCGGTGLEPCVRCRKQPSAIEIDGDGYCSECAADSADEFADLLEARMAKAFGPAWMDNVG